MTTYAIADEVPPECDYITAGKEYEVVAEEGGGFWFFCDDNQQIWCLWLDSLDLNGGNWRRVERD